MSFAAKDTNLSQLRQLSLVKDGHRYVFRYQEGDEESLIQELMDMAGRTDLGFDWFDAAMLSRQVNERLLRRLEE
jgi:hypothetical protein